MEDGGWRMEDGGWSPHTEEEEEEEERDTIYTINRAPACMSSCVEIAPKRLDPFNLFLEMHSLRRNMDRRHANVVLYVYVQCTRAIMDLFRCATAQRS